MTCIIGHVEPYACILPATATRGALYQGSRPDESVREITGPLVIVSLDRDCKAEQWIDGAHTVKVLDRHIADTSESRFPDGILLSTVGAITRYLESGHHVLIHCQMGVSRSSYLSLAVLMQLRGWTLAEAETHLVSVWDRAQPNRGFRAHLVALEGVLKG